MFEVSYSANVSDDGLAIVYGRDPDLLFPFQKFGVIAASLAGELYIVEDAVTGTIIGTASWFGPGRDLFDSEDQREAALVPLMSRVSPELKQWWTEHSEAVRTSIMGPGTITDSWYLESIGVLPDYQRKGVAKALIQMVQKKAAITSTNICLQASSHNIPMYEQLGFKYKGEAALDSPYGKMSICYMLLAPKDEPYFS
ncbi:hypothetical protein PILCRDRAFT_2007 [Piloderma croceum F 1598]|uniref:N-acetyltransferase domain-containing protein n=1 Tax=Piloderma croceum (strain F 1598) TaxID=765440 RepID=A0A0C3CJ12_PILCF|nr:hypothetical protein PILCRDRAFT_2007 [Piloderma croceum F 1598]